MKDVDDANSAFPRMDTDYTKDETSEENYPHVYSYGGISIRDYFAAAVLPSCYTTMMNLSSAAKEESKKLGEPHVLMAQMAYEVADAMLKERSKTT